MTRFTETRTETIEHEINVVQCDLCGEEVPMSQFGINSNGFEQFASAMSGRIWWWMKPLNKIVGIAKGSAADEEKRSDFDVHAKCAYDVLKAAVDKANL